MPDTVRTDAEILALLADNTTGLISAQDLRDAYVSLVDRIADAAIPDQFTFTNVTGANLNNEISHAPITLTGLAALASAQASGALAFTVNDGPLVTRAIVQNGDVIVAKMISASDNLTEVTGALVIGSVSDSWSITTGTFWTPDVALREQMAFGFFQEDLSEGTVNTWVSRGVKPRTAGGTATKLTGRSGVKFAKGTTQNLQWPTDTDAPFLHRWWVVIARVDTEANPGHNAVPVLTVHTAQGGDVYNQPYVDLRSNSTMVSRIRDADGAKGLVGTSDPAFANWNVLVGWQRGWEHCAWINGVKTTPLAFKSMRVPNHSFPAWLGAGTSSPGSATLGADLAIDCVIVGQSELNDAQIDKLVGWAHWRAGRDDLLAGDHPYKAGPETELDENDDPARYVHDETAWDTYSSAIADFTNFGLAPPAADATYKRVFFDDFLVDSIADSHSGDPTAIWFAPGWNTAIGTDATLLAPGSSPDLYPHTAGALTDGGTGSIKLLLTETTANSGQWRVGAFYSVNLVGKGRWWSKGRFIARIRFTNFGAPPRPGFFPAWWYYDNQHLFWRTRNRIELDWFEHEGGAVVDDRIAQTLHVHEPKLGFSHDDVRATHDSAGVISSNHINLNAVADSGSVLPRAWTENFSSYTGWHVYEMRVESDFIYNILDGLEIGRRAVCDELLFPRYMIFDQAYRTFQGVAVAGETYEMEIDYVEVWVKEADLAVVPTGFSGRPTLAGTRGEGNTITVTPNTTASQIEYRWYKDGEPIVGEASATFIEDTDSATKALRVHVRAVSLLDQPEAWTAELDAEGSPPGSP